MFFPLLLHAMLDCEFDRSYTTTKQELEDIASKLSNVKLISNAMCPRIYCDAKPVDTNSIYFGLTRRISVPHNGCQ
jgi:hypothetical protein